MLMNLFATFVAFVSGVVFITEAVNKLFKIEGSTPKLIVSWVMSLGLAAVGFALQLGIFSTIGAVDTWQGWVKCALIGIGCGLAANKIYDREEIWKLLEQIFSLFKKKYVHPLSGKEIETPSVQEHRRLSLLLCCK